MDHASPPLQRSPHFEVNGRGLSPCWGRVPVIGIPAGGDVFGRAIKRLSQRFMVWLFSLSEVLGWPPVSRRRTDDGRDA